MHQNNFDMQKLIFTILTAFVSSGLFAQCTTSNASGCVCPDGSQMCDLLPDITISGFGLLNHLDGPDEFSQSGNGPDDGRIRLSGSTPNIGYGAFTVGAEDIWTCGTDTFYDYTLALTVCAEPKQLIKQKIWHKDGNSMSFTERWAGSMTYHPTHGHMHVDDWAIFSLRYEDPNDPNPLNWPVVGDGSKIGFCLMDYGSCPFYDGHCRDDSNNVLNNSSQFPNYGHGGGNYNCSPVEQGISVGYTDIYGEYLDGMWIDVPPGICNGEYWIVVEVDPHNYFLEMNVDNNWAAAPFTLTQQNAPGTGYAEITASAHTTICEGDAIELTSTYGNTYLWSTGETTQTITVSDSGTYTVDVTNYYCGIATSAPVSIEQISIEAVQSTSGTTVCQNSEATLNATGSNIIGWYDAPNGGNFLHSGSSFTTTNTETSNTFYAANEFVIPGNIYFSEPHDDQFGASGYHGGQFNGYQIFDCWKEFELASVKVFTDYAGERIIELRNAAGNVLESRTVNIAEGESRVDLNFQVTPGLNYQLGTNEVSNNNVFGNSSPQLKRNDDGVNYPYVISSVMQITGCRYGPDYYYYFYDWELKEADFKCSSDRVPVELTVNQLPVVSFSGLESEYDIADDAVTLTGSPAGGVFDGQGITGDSFDPWQAGEGGPYLITYTYTDGNGCTNSHSIEVTVQKISGIGSIESKNFRDIRVFPNPNIGLFDISFNLKNRDVVLIDIVNLAGQVIFKENNSLFPGQFSKTYDLAGLGKGVYFVKLTANEGKATRKLVVQ